jgi:hypothetical protein
VTDSIWQAVKAKKIICASKEDIRRLVTDDSRMAEYDDMFDCAKVGSVRCALKSLFCVGL